MKLFYSPNSPYARKARVIIREKNLSSIEEISVMPTENPPELWAVNPLGTVPALATDDGLHGLHLVDYIHFTHCRCGVGSSPLFGHIA